MFFPVKAPAVGRTTQAESRDDVLRPCPVPAAEFRKRRQENKKQAVRKNARRNAGRNKAIDEGGENDGQPGRTGSSQTAKKEEKLKTKKVAGITCNFCCQLVPRGRLELPRHSALPPQDSVSTNSTTWAQLFLYSKAHALASIFFTVRHFFFSRPCSAQKNAVSSAPKKDGGRNIARSGTS